MRKTTQQSMGEAARFSARLYFLKTPGASQAGGKANEQLSDENNSRRTAVESLAEPENADVLAVHRSPEGHVTHTPVADGWSAVSGSPSASPNHEDVKSDDEIPSFLMKLKDIEVEQPQATQMSALLGGASAGIIAGRATAGHVKRLTRTICSRNHDAMSCGAGVLVGILMLAVDLSIQTTNASEQPAVIVNQAQANAPLQARLINSTSRLQDRRNASLMAGVLKASAAQDIKPPPTLAAHTKTSSDAPLMQDMASNVTVVKVSETAETVVLDTSASHPYVTLNPTPSGAEPSVPEVIEPPATIQAIEPTQISARDDLNVGPAMIGGAPTGVASPDGVANYQMSNRDFATRQKAVLKSELSRSVRNSDSGRSKFAATQAGRPSGRVKRQAQPYKVGAPGAVAKTRFDRASKAKADAATDNPPFVAARTLDEAMSR